MTDRTAIARFSSEDVEAHLAGLTEILHASVMAGASINFILPYAPSDAARFWIDKVRPALDGGKLVMLVSWVEGRIAGTVQLDCDMPPNQPHRAEIRKLMVHPAFRNRGIARALMMEIERVAADQGRSLITLDTRTGDKAEPLYASLGYVTFGIVPGYARDVSEDRFDDCSFMYKRLGPQPGASV
ncbi:MAG: GNAT family N-acetyltransferase [Rhizobium sp.]|nr:GNAT family N-acetyltransferase [Rhizobium sp.]